ncbi:NAD(P)H-dependent oxidoreductase [Leucobacter allii]|uniref:FMN dependent NADH:quinone oxidoreductase n=1 Tax=Leucobacter allii TaxID=2932247 RepID=A0ABY4FKR2_9MICO|nr:NAD(P)H-dependent oxidoreductase [Leucobacter allii]UOQ56862.1 NAD(P)H-dependent oxidoreductase [Leucobacter allii]
MPTLLHIDSAIADAESRTRRLTRAAVEAWRGRGDGYTVVSRDLHADPPSHLRERSQHWPERLREGAPLDRATEEIQERLIAELLGADALVIGAPMYNFNIPSTLKAWVDLVHVPGITSPFDAEVRPLRGRPAVIVTSQGGPREDAVEHLATAPLRHLLGAAFGMEVHVVGTSRTLAERIPELGVDEADALFADAEAETVRLGSTI